MTRAFRRGVVIGAVAAPVYAALHWFQPYYHEASVVVDIHRAQTRDEVLVILEREGMLA